jgi:hypothetical protein
MAIETLRSVRRELMNAVTVLVLGAVLIAFCLVALAINRSNRKQRASSEKGS